MEDFSFFKIHLLNLRYRFFFRGTALNSIQLLYYGCIDLLLNKAILQQPKNNTKQKQKQDQQFSKEKEKVKLKRKKNDFSEKGKKSKGNEHMSTFSRQ